ncbi:hypothetical protein [Streptomyces sp. H39-C1]|uniref:hypothetical protein n=1 Tax=Streptomyces sp. H39-C1 TaxID=3004355 RepID=UPI0022AE6596|nr:hypothetical protein [Streptomyces sp. H39-C1]MCZ4102353.1 hypothetical protein [Streptomyces sp. H39-C1]
MTFGVRIRIARRTLPLITGAACLTLALAACTNGSSSSPAAPTPTTSSVAKPAPALSAAQAKAVIARYSVINNKANATDDRALLNTIEDDSMYAMSLAEYTEYGGLTKAERKPYTPWSYDLASARLYIPRVTAGQSRWFVAALSTAKGKAPSRLAVFSEQPEHQRWEMVSVTDLDNGTLPSIALDSDGYATAVAPNDPRLAAGADLLRNGVLDNFATGGTTTGQKVFAPTEASKRQIKVHVETGRQYGSQGTSVFAGTVNSFPDAYALKTTDGGALILFSHTHTQTDTVAHAGLEIIPGKDDRAWLHDIPRLSIRYTFVCDDAATVPAKGAPSRLIGYTCARTDASGPPSTPRQSDRA